MKITQYVFLLLLSLFTLISSCKKDEKPTQVEIKYSLNDDVSPVNAVLKINHKLRYAKWEIDSIIRKVFDQDTLEYMFEKEDTAVIKLIAEGIHDEEYFGNIDIIIPKVATKLILYGCYLQDSFDMGIVEDTIIFRFDYYDGTEYHYQSISIPKIEFEDNDSILFKEPIIIDIAGFENDEDYSRGVNFNIEGLHNVQSYFKSRIGIRNWYYHDRLFDPDEIYLDNLRESNERIFIKSDWTR